MCQFLDEILDSVYSRNDLLLLIDRHYTAADSSVSLSADGSESLQQSTVGAERPVDLQQRSRLVSCE